MDLIVYIPYSRAGKMGERQKENMGWGNDRTQWWWQQTTDWTVDMTTGPVHRSRQMFSTAILMWAMTIYVANGPHTELDSGHFLFYIVSASHVILAYFNRKCSRKLFNLAWSVCYSSPSSVKKRKIFLSKFISFSIGSLFLYYHV